MTEKEAIKILQELSLERCETFVFDCGNCDKCEVTIAYDMAIKALEKQIAKTPLESDLKIRYCEVFKCPNCGFEFSGRVSKYCYRCGQALDWGSEEE